MRVQYLLWLIWSLALWGTLKIADLPLPPLHGVCGPWGCGPPLEALFACHGAWLVCFIPAAWFGMQRFTTKQIFHIGCVLTSLGLMMILAVGLYERLIWLPQANEFARRFFLQRWAFSVVTMTDVPLIPITLSGMIILFSSYYSRLSEFSSHPAEDSIRSSRTSIN
ncbi:MAG: hypothetical protein ABIK07_21690 [Planctomycetota bacterium]